MTSKRLPVCEWLCAAALGLVLSQPVAATAIANSSIDFANLEISPDSGTVVLLDLWTLAAFAEANNSLGEADADFDTALSPAMANAAASVAFAAASGNATALGDPPDFEVTGSAASSVNIPGCDPAAAFAKGLGTLFNSFVITGGTGTVNVDFGVDISGALKVMTDDCGVKAETETIFSLELDGNPILFRHDLLSIGPNSSQTLTFSERLATTVSLDFDTEHFLLLQLDSESSGLVPEPPMIALLLVGLGGLLLTGRS